ncbi:hypothetical protein [uncultured Clostridium sp.]|uniref:hypothetical protein n=1 Tax=uncultured Clostridium sp. TaxID=59620 RepID=UPI0025D4EF10|nr:hypothetical protein [uncultured Clostridium sp.]
MIGLKQPFHYFDRESLRIITLEKGIFIEDNFFLADKILKGGFGEKVKVPEKQVLEQEENKEEPATFSRRKGKH